MINKIKINKFRILWTIIFVLLLILVLIFYYYSKNEQIIDNKITQNTLGSNQIINKEKDIKKNIIQKKDDDIEKIPINTETAIWEINKEDNKKLEQALKSLNIKLCDEIKDVMIKTICKDKVFEANLENISNTEYCKIFSNQMNEKNCIYKVTKNLIKNSSSIEICNKLDDSMKKNDCRRDFIIKNAKKWINKCYLTDDIMLKWECRKEYSVSKWVLEKSLKYCEDNFADQMEKSFCISQIIDILNEDENTTSYCSLYNDSLRKEECEWKIQ